MNCVAQTDNYLFVVTTKTSKSRIYTVDSGTSDHMLGDISLFYDFKFCMEDIFAKVANNSLIKVKVLYGEFNR